MKMPYCAGLTRKSKTTLGYDGLQFLDGRASDPQVLGWMYGLPPAADKVVTFASDRTLEFPEIRWTASHMRELVPTVCVRRGGGVISPLPESQGAVASSIETLEFTDMSGRRVRFEDALHDSYTDGILVMHRGCVVYERYFGALSKEIPHACFSVTKSYAGTLAAQLVHEGVLDAAKLIPHYVPELRGTAWEDATLRQVMDMEIDLRYDEEYTDERSGARAYMRATGLRPQPEAYGGARTLCEYLLGIRKDGRHGQAFDYKSPNTDVMAWAMSRATGKTFTELLHERIWEPLGCEEDGYMIVDSAGTPMAGGGLCATLRDLARFGEMMRRDGDWNGHKVISPAVVAEIRAGGDREKFAKFQPIVPGSYKNMWWPYHDDFDAFEAVGIHGQRLWIAPGAEMVIARFASRPIAKSGDSDSLSLALFYALAETITGLRA